MKMIKIGLLLVGVASIVLVTQAQNPSSLENLELARVKWNNRDFKDYEFDLMESPSFPDWISMKVANGTVTAARFTFDRSAVQLDVLSSLRTIDGFFDLIQNSLNEPALIAYVTYHEQLGYPRSISIRKDYRSAIAVHIENVIAFTEGAEFTNKARRQSELDSAVAKWNNRGFSDYDMVLKRNSSCECSSEWFEEISARIIDESIESAIYTRSGSTVQDEYVPFTINELFDFLQNRIEKNAIVFSVNYHGTLGYPLGITLNIHPFLDDAAFGWHTISLTPIGPDVIENPISTASGPIVQTTYQPSQAPTNPPVTLPVATSGPTTESPTSETPGPSVQPTNQPSQAPTNPPAALPVATSETTTESPVSGTLLPILLTPIPPPLGTNLEQPGENDLPLGTSTAARTTITFMGMVSAVLLVIHQ